MDISSLLSPQDSPTATPPPPTHAPRSSAKKALKPRTSKASTNSSHLSHTSTPTLLSHNTAAPLQRQDSSPANGSPGTRQRTSVSSTPSGDGSRTYRQPSTAGMDTLADLASMQHHQQTARANATGLRSAETLVATTLPSLQNMTRSEATSRLRAGSFDVTMTDSPQSTPTPRVYHSKALSESELQIITEAGNQVLQNPFASETYTKLINLLHRGLLNHIRLQSSSNTSGDPHSYELLRDLQGARENMSARFAIGEDLWADWIQDQILLATSFEDKLSIRELCEKAVNEETTSSKVWLIYGQWMLSEYHRLMSREERTNTNKNGELAPDEERLMALEIFGWQQVLSVWQRATQETLWRINDSNQLWDQYTDLLLQDLEGSGQKPQPDIVAKMQRWFMARLQIPHATWDQTSQKFSTFLSAHDNANWESTMVRANHLGAEAKHKYEMRDFKEINVLRASQKGDQEAELQAFSEYIDYETSLSRKRNAFSVDLINALYQRALLRFPARTELWEAYIMFLNEEIVQHKQQDLSILPILDKATRHCPWSGTLWAQYLLAAEIADVSFAGIGEIKHRATSSGILDLNEMDEILMVTTAWCGYLRRRAFKSSSTDEEMDVAEVGIRSAIEDVETVGHKKYGKGYQGDPEYRLEKIYIKYLTQARNWSAARETFRKLIPRKGHDYDFWLRYYVFEMVTWAKLTYSEGGPDSGRFVRPTEATRVLQQAMRRNDLNWPEKIVQTYLHHCEDHEDAEQLQSANIEVWKQNNVIKKRREKEAYEQYQYQLAQQQLETPGVPVNGDDQDNLGKRKRDDNVEEAPSKKTRPEEMPSIEPQIQEQSPPAPSQLKRDRENATVIVKNLPVATTEARVRHYFRDCGTINSLKVLREEDGHSATASIEFESKEDVLTAQTRDMKSFDGNDIEVQVGSGTTLYVCNFPPTADEAWIRDKFKEFGEIVDVRFPSLKYNNHRRFAYIQFKWSNQAQAATALDGEKLEGDLELLAKISDPTKKQKRQGPMYEGRELFILNVPANATIQDLKKLFSQHGSVESVRLPPPKLNGEPKGFAWVVYRHKEDAEKGLALNLTNLNGRTLKVIESTNDKEKREASKNASRSQRTTASPSVGPNGDTETAATSDLDARIKREEIQSRTLALLNVPDTINDARIRQLAEPHGEIVRLLLRPDHQGAIIEYKEQSSVGKASLALDGYEIQPDRRLGVGTVNEMKQMKAEKKSDKLKPAQKKKETVSALPAPTLVRRPGVGAGRRGGKGGLGLKRSGVGLDGDRAKPMEAEGKEEGDAEGDGAEKGWEKESAKPKSNADFKAMMLGGGEKK